ncbi:NAD(P)H-hydrate dehydratase [Miniphocaeibacter massiliensis]|uniref:NAD(P)H-hydrate dehydratase n=1 Tax=Miniphocaeibacter massiliensis TaxID=2041841 RepID=UPI000C0717F8|nr:NAD(P)H-hydrate dehydratase [Miniphocaeibacter massiliensis]
MAIGIDITKTKRLEKYIDDYKLYNRIFTNKEIELINSKNGKRKLEIIAGRFSAKEAISKALGTGIGEVAFKDIEVLNNKDGKPEVFLYRKAKEKWKILYSNNPDISISHDGEYTLAVVNEKNHNLFFDIDEDISKLLKKRRSDSHKGDYGKVAFVGGSRGMCGSIYLASLAALRTGAGLVYTVVPEEIETIMQIKSLENIVWPINYNNLENYKDKFNKIDAFGIGPGMGDGYSFEVIKFYLENYNKNFVIDADGLNMLSKNLGKIPRNKNIIFTPHEMEMSRMTDMDINHIHANREEISIEFAKKYGIILILKGKNTIVTDGNIIYINKTGNPGMATAGSGDVLTGIITALIAQDYELIEAAKLAVYVHGLSGDIACSIKGEDGIIARDIIENIPSAMKLMKEN